jgi:hypothetical protein
VRGGGSVEFEGGIKIIQYHVFPPKIPGVEILCFRVFQSLFPSDVDDWFV